MLAYICSGVQSPTFERLITITNRHTSQAVRYLRLVLKHRTAD